MKIDSKKFEALKFFATKFKIDGAKIHKDYQPFEDIPEEVYPYAVVLHLPNGEKVMCAAITNSGSLIITDNGDYSEVVTIEQLLKLTSPWPTDWTPDKFSFEKPLN